ncbi:MAG: hypothetical protein IPN62_17125 [Flavobacteriales bacterium]|nr:hypothetical protein [Flavobacteriales bacterium]
MLREGQDLQDGIIITENAIKQLGYRIEDLREEDLPEEFNPLLPGACGRRSSGRARKA